MTRADDVESFRHILTIATERVGEQYFLLPVADQDGGAPIIQYRERVYSYELYHQLRLAWPTWGYSLGGEVDKRNHPVIHGPDLDNAKPGATTGLSPLPARLGREAALPEPSRHV